MKSKINYLAQYGKDLINNGYNIYPCKRASKAIYEREWQNNPLTIESFQSKIDAGQGAYGVSILTRNTPAVDIDILNPAAAEHMKTWVIDNIIAKQQNNNPLIRVGQTPKLLILFKSKSPILKLSSQRFKDELGNTNCIEILGSGQQCVAFNTHPITKSDYEWVSKHSPLTLPTTNLPVLSIKTATSILIEFERYAESQGWSSEGEFKQPQPSNDDEYNIRLADFMYVNDQLNTVEEAERNRISNLVVSAIDFLIDNKQVFEDRNLWMRLTHALATAKGTDFEELFAEQYKKITTDLDKDGHRWDSCTPSQTNWAVILSSAKELGWQASEKKVIQNNFFQRVGQLEIKPNDWLIRNFIERDAFSLIYGPSASCKSFIAIDLALCVATGTSWHGKKTKEGAVFYISGEGTRGFVKRTQAWSNKKDICIKDAPIFLSQHAVPLMSENSALEVINKIDITLKESKLIPELIVIDTLHNCFDGNENDASDMGAFLRCLSTFKQKFSCSIIIVHHSGKVSSTTARGSSSLRAGVDAEYQVTRKGDFVTFENTKMKDAEIQMCITFEPEEISLYDHKGALIYDDDGANITSLALSKVNNNATKEPPKGKNQLAIYQELMKQSADEFPYSKDMLRQSCCKELKLMTKKAFDVALESIITGRYISIDEEGEITLL